MYVDDESFIDMATSISGSGPAYVFFMMESMIDAGVHMGFPRTYNQNQSEKGKTLSKFCSLLWGAFSPDRVEFFSLFCLLGDKAATLVYHTMLGSTLYAMETGEHPAILRK